MASPSAGDTHAETGNARVLNPLSSYIHLTGSLGSDIGAQCRNEQRQESSEPNTATSRNWEDKSARPETTQNLMQPVSDGLSVDFIARHTSDETLRRRANSNDRESIPLSDERMPENFYNRNWERAQPNHTQTQHPVDPQPLPRPSPVSNRLSADFIALHTQDKTLQHEQNDNKVKISNTTAPTDQKKAEDDDNSPDVATVLAQVLRNKRVQTKNEVEVQRNNPSSPLHSVKSFEDLPLSEELRRGIYDMGFNKPSKIQETALLILLADPPNNMIAQSQSGTGKTTAFVLPMLSRVDATQNFTQVICLSPTYELSLQTGQVAEKMSKFCPEIKIGYTVGEVSVSPGHKVTDHILFGTPGTMLDWICKHKLVDQRKIKMCVLDEADVMIAGQGYQDQSIGIYKTLTKDCQMLLFSATFDDEVMKFANEVVPDPTVIRLRPEEESLDNIKQFYVECRDQEDKQQALSNMYAVLSIGQCIVFCETRESASWLETKMTAEGHSVAVLSEEMTEEERLAVWNRFRDGKARLLIATNVCARGIDVEQVTLVVNYDMPVEPSGEPDFETYLHRIGRTGRFGKNGIAVNFIDCSKALNILKKIEEHFGGKISLLETNDVEELEKLN